MRRTPLLLGVLALALSAGSALAQQPYAPYGYLQPSHLQPGPGYQGHWQYGAMEAATPATTLAADTPIAMPANVDGPKPAYAAMVVNPVQPACCGTPGCQMTPAGPQPCFDQPCGQLPCFDQPCCAPEPCCHKHCCLVGGAGVYYLRPYWENNPAFATFFGSEDVVGNALATETDFDYEYEFAPYAWAGWVSECGLGVRGRGFYFKHDAETATVVDADPNEGDQLITFATAGPLGLGIFTQQGGPETLTINSELRILAVDLEVTQQFQVGCWWLLLSGGGRWAEMAQNYDADFDDQTDDVQTIALRSGHNFRGAGPTVGLEARRPFCCGFALFGSARGSLLIGNRTENSFLLSVDADNAADSDLFARLRDDHDVMPIGELELGVEYGQEIKGARLFVQAAVVNHTWFGAGNASNTSTALGADTDDTFDSFFFNGSAADDRSNLSLFGGKLVIGLQY